MFRGNVVLPEFMSSIMINGVVIIISIALIIKGKLLRDNKSSSGISASSNETSTGTALIICGVLTFIAHVVNIVKSFGLNSKRSENSQLYFVCLKAC